MSDISNFSDSDAGDLLKELDKLDDLDDKLLGAKKPIAPKEEETLEQASPFDQKKSIDDFDDDDDPLADLLSEETKQKTKSLLQKSLALAAKVEPLVDASSEPPLVKQEPPKKQETILSPSKDDENLGSLQKGSAERSPKRSPKRQITKKAEVDFGDDDLLDDLGFDEKPKTKEVERRGVEKPARTTTMKTDNIFGDDDLLDDLGFGGAPSKQRGREQEKPLGRRAVSFMDDLMGAGPDKKSSLEPKEFSLGDRYKSPTAQVDTEPNVGYNPSVGGRNELPRRRRTVDDAASSTPALKKQQALDSLFDDPPAIKPSSTIASPEKKLISRRPASSPAADWLGGTGESSPKKNLQADWLGPTDKTRSVDWLGGSAGPEDVPDKGSVMTKEKEVGLDWLQLKNNLKSKDNVPELTRNVVNSPKHSNNVSPMKTKQAAQLASPKFETTIVTEESNQRASTVNREVAEMVANIQGANVSAQIERDQLMKTIENLNERHKEELKSTEDFYKNQLKTAEDLHKDTENRYRTDFRDQIQGLQESVTRLEKGKAELVLLQQEKAEKVEREHRQEVDRLKDIHSQALVSLRQEHQESLSRLQRLKEQELHAMASAQEHSRSVQQVMMELEAKTAQLSSLQERLEGHHQEALEGRRAALEAKEQQLKALEVRHQRAHEESEEERSRLQQLVLRLEKRMVDQTRELEEERWKVLQERGRLESRSQALEEKQEEVEHQMARDRNRLQQAKDLCLQEQRGIWLQVAQERQALSDRDAILRRKEEDIQRIQSKRMQEEIRLESEQRNLQQERVRLDAERVRLREEEIALTREKATFQALREKLKEEVDAAEVTTALLKKRERELDDKSRSCAQSREDGQLALATARQLEDTLQQQQQKISQQIQTLHEKERKVMKEKILMLDELQRLENTRNSLICANCRLSYIRPLGATNSLNSSPHVLQPSYAPLLLKQVSEQPSLLIWKLLADKDKVFLEEEQRYLDSLSLPSADI